SGPFLDNPALIPLDPGMVVENPIYIPGGQWESAYGQLWDKVLDVVADYFTIVEYNRYDGRIVTAPRIAPGLGHLLKPGSPDFDERLLATMQPLRHRAEILIQPANQGGFFVHVTVYKELEDLPRPTRSTAGAAIFRAEASVERQFEVIDPTVFESTWIP